MGRPSSKLRFEVEDTRACVLGRPRRSALQMRRKKNLLQRLLRGLGVLGERWKRPARALNPGTRGALLQWEQLERVGAKQRLSRRLPDFVALLLGRAFGSKSTLAWMVSVVLPFEVESSNYQREWALLAVRTSRSAAVRPRKG
jgi:hypothetical protein